MENVDNPGENRNASEKEMARRVRDFDWAATGLGPAESWPQSLRTSVQMVVDAPFPNIVLWGPQLIQIYNDGYRDLMGVKHPKGFGQPTRDCWPEVWHINEPVYRRVWMGESVSFEDALYPVTRSGVLEDAWFTLSYSPIRDEAGSVAGILVTVFETTERKRAEEALRESEERFRIMVEGAQDYAMFLLNLNGDITFWSKGAERLFGWMESEALNQKDAIIFTPENREIGKPEQSRQQALSDGSLVVREWKQRKDGSQFWIDGILMRLDDANGAPYGFAKVARDATDQKRGEEAVETAVEAVAQANEELEARVQERTHALSERTDELAAMAKRRQELVRRLVTAQEAERASIARDLHDDTGQQITGLLLGLAALKNNATLAGDAGALSAVSDLQRMADDIAQKSHRIALNLRPTALDDIGLIQALTNYAEQWRSWSGVGLALDSVGMKTTEGQLCRFSADTETTIYRVVQEALTNVLRHATGKDGNKSARIVSVLIQANANDVLTLIEDDGPGFDVEATQNVSPSKRRIGLFGMQERALLMGGTLDIESTVGSGTTVYLRIPLSPAPRAVD